MRRSSKAILSTISGVVMVVFFVPVLYAPDLEYCAPPCPNGEKVCTGPVPVLPIVYPHYGSITYAYLGLGGFYGRGAFDPAWHYEVEQNLCVHL